MRARGDGYVLERKRGGKATGKWYVRLPWTHGERVERYVGKTRRAAEKVRRQLLALRDRGVQFHQGMHKVFGDALPDAYCIRDLADAFLQDAEGSTRRASTIRSFRSKLSVLKASPLAGIALRSMEARDVVGWFAQRITGSLRKKLREFREECPDADADEVEHVKTKARVSAGRTCNRYKAFLSEFFKWAAQQGLVDEMQFDRIRKGLPKYGEENDFGVVLDAQAEGGSEIAKLLAGMPEHFRPLVLFGVLTGMREGEIAALEWSQVNFARCEITVSAAGSKGKKSKTVRLPLAANRLLRELRAEDSGVGRVFLTPEGTPWRDERISRTFSRVVRAGVGGLSKQVSRDMRFHDLRHTCAVTMLRGGAALHEVRDQLGHSSIQVTQKYTKYVMGSKERAAAAMDRMMAADHVIEETA